MALVINSDRRPFVCLEELDVVRPEAEPDTISLLASRLLSRALLSRIESQVVQARSMSVSYPVQPMSRWPEPCLLDTSLAEVTRRSLHTRLNRERVPEWLRGAAHAGDETSMAILLDIIAAVPIVERSAWLSKVLEESDALVVAAQQGHDRVVSLLLQKIHYRDYAISLPRVMEHAIRAGHVKVVRELLNAGFKVDSKIEFVSALGIAVQCGHRDIVRVLLGAGADPDAICDVRSRSWPLHFAVSNNYPDIAIELLAAGAGFDHKNDEGETIGDLLPGRSIWRFLRIAKPRGCVDIKEHLQAMPDVGLPAISIEELFPALYRAAQNGDALLVRRLFRTYHAQINYRAKEQVFFVGRSNGHLSIVGLSEVREVLEKCHGEPLITASQQGHTLIVEWLLQTPVDSGTWRTALEGGAQRGHSEVVRALLAYDNDLRYRGTGNDHKLARYSALKEAVVRRHQDVVTLFLEDMRYYAPPGEQTASSLYGCLLDKNNEFPARLQPELFDKQTRDGLLPLHFATVLGSCAGVGALLGRGVYVDCRDCKGRTALHWAIFANHKDVARMLLRYGARVDAQDFLGKTVRQWADELGRGEILGD